MLFLAVFCGFLAENQREHMIENNREKQFVTSLINDLKLDAAWLDTVTNSAKLRIQNIDSAILFLSRLQTNEIPVKVYQHLQRSTGQIMFFSNNGTITQLKSSGGMRLIRNREAVDSIQAYDRLMRRLEVRRDIINQLTHDFIEILDKTITGNDLLRTFYDSVFYSKKGVKNQPIRINNQSLNELINKSISVRLRTAADTIANFSTRSSALRLIIFLEKEYHLK
jgi:hypothetical protein